MKMKKLVVSTLAGLIAFSSASMADAKSDEYIKTFGMMMFQRAGLADLQFTPAEFDLFVQGMKHMNDGGELPENIQQNAADMMQYLGARAEANMAKVAEKTEAAAKDFWTELSKKEGLKKTDTGLAYEIIEEGTGPLPTENSDVVVKYTGTLVDGKVFDSTDRAGGEPAKFNLSRVIPGFREGLQKVGKGGKARIYIPAELGYGTQAIPGIPPSSTLIFDVEVLDVDPDGTPAPMPSEDEAK